jgi:predicted glutamine amidotransferase
MCGILGYIASPTDEATKAKVFKFATTLLMSSVSRGKDASGFAALFGMQPSDDTPMVTDKKPLPPTNFILSSKAYQGLRKNIPTIFIGHTRHSTSGDPKKGRNNHPFHNRRYSLVHNGHVSNWKDSAKKLKLTMRTETDSEVLIRLLNPADDHEKAIEGMVKSIDSGSRLATAVLDREKHKLILCRTNNPTWILPYPNWRAIFFASTDDIIKAAIQMAGEGFGELSDIKPFESKADAIFTLGFDEEGYPTLMGEKEITKVEVKTTTTSNPISSAAHSTAADTIKSIGGASPILIGENGTKQLPVSRNIIRPGNNMLATMAILPVIKSLTSSPVMTQVEREHWTKWFNE